MVLASDAGVFGREETVREEEEDFFKRLDWAVFMRGLTVLDCPKLCSHATKFSPASIPSDVRVGAGTAPELPTAVADGMAAAERERDNCPLLVGGATSPYRAGATRWAERLERRSGMNADQTKK